ncbi:hypothetical protein [Rhizobium rhizogenes]|uniref:hypothetical protein n=1 Tax=Rhizobium rhizogenes TaxID=359 RepID=UPI001574A443|nr:hypothetical protein [Rhizobium rhizogenes]NTF65762.1 hypothetical protein [Rhizobium rhizogenes]NTG97114.1 hypothetical protein [Rhizobium rhizogenes]
MLAPQLSLDEIQRKRIQDAVRTIVIPGATKVSETNEDLSRATFLTGSFSRDHFDTWLPNVNIYFVAHAGKGPQLRLAVADWFAELRSSLASRSLFLEVDCHPYSIAEHVPDVERGSLLTLTSKVLEADRTPRLSLPPTIGLGWLRSFEVLFGDQDFLLKTLPHPGLSHDLDWFASVHEALARYKGLLDHLPWAMAWQNSPELLSREALRYAEEAIRDAVPVCLTESELQAGMQFDLLHHWAGGADELLVERLGVTGRRIVHIVASLKARAREADEVDVAQAKADWLAALEVWQGVWDAFTHLVERECPQHSSWLSRVNAFV